MHALLVILVVIGGICAVVYIKRVLLPDGYEATPRQIRDELQKIIDGHDPYAWDDFISSPLSDPRFETIRLRVAQLSEEFPPESKGEIYGPKGDEVIRGYIRELEHETAT